MRDRKDSIESETKPIKRRDALKTLGTGTFAVGGLFTTTASAAPDTRKVPALLSGDTVVEYMEVPTVWYQHVKQVRKAKSALTEQIGDQPYVFSVGLVGQDTKFGGKKGLQIRVQVTDTSRATNMAESIDGVPVLTEPAPDSYGPAGCYNDESESNVVGGELVGWENGGYGTATATVIQDPGGASQDQLLHCGHVFWRDCNDAKNGGIVGRGVKRGDDGDGTAGTHVGKVVKYDRKGDYALIDNDNTGAGFARLIDDNDGIYPDTVGRVSQTKIDSMASSSGENVYNMGATTGLTEGQIVASDKSFAFTCTNFRDEGVESTTNFANGDSGGPTYVLRDNQNAYITHVSSYRYYDRNSTTTCAGNTAQMGNAVGTAGYYIQNNENISFG